MSFNYEDIDNFHIYMNDEYEVLSEDDVFRDFVGVVEANSVNVVEITFTNGFVLRVTKGTEIRINDGNYQLISLLNVGDVLYGNCVIKTIKDVPNSVYVNDLLEVNTSNSFKINELYVKQCCIVDEYAFVSGSIAEEFDKSVFPTISSASDKSKRNDAKIVLISTPNGLNHFYAKWKKAISGKSDFTPFEVKWTDVPGRDEAFKQDIIDSFGERYWAQEFECVTGDTEVILRTESGEEYTITMEELFKWHSNHEWSKGIHRTDLQK